MQENTLTHGVIGLCCLWLAF